MKIKHLPAVLCILLALACISGSASAQTVYGLFGLPAADIGKKQAGTLDPGNGNVALLGTSNSIDPGQLATPTGATAISVDANRMYFIGRDAANINYVFTVDLGTGLLVTKEVLVAGIPAPVALLAASNNFGVWYDEPAQVLYALFSTPAGDREVVSIDPATGQAVSVSGPVAGTGLVTAGGVFSGDSIGERVFFLGTPDDDDAQFYTVSIGDGSVTQVPLQDYDQNTIQGIEWDGVSELLWAIVHGRDGERQLATIDIDGGEVLADFDPFDDGDPIATSTGLIALDSASQRLFFIGRNTVWSIYTVDLTDGSGTPQAIDNSMIQTNGYAGIEVVPGPDLSLSKDDGGISAMPGDTISYTLTAGNALGAGTSNVTEIVETVPANTQFNAGASTAGWGCTPDANAGSTCTLALPDLASGDSNVSTFAVDVLSSVAAGTVQISNSATLQAFNTLTSVMASDVTPLTSAAALSLGKSDGDVGGIPGGTVVYTLTVGNTGNQDTANLILGETVPANSTFNAGSSAPGWACLPDGSSGSACSITLGTLAGGSNSPVAFAVDVDNPVAVGVTELQNTATAIADNATAVNAVDSTPVTASPMVAVSITDMGITAIPGDVVVYQIDYANNGNQDAESANLAMFVPAQTTFVPGSSSAGWMCGPGPGVVQCDLDLGTVAGGGAGGSVNIAVVIDDPVMAGTTAIDAAVSLNLLNGLPDDATDSTPLTAEPTLVLYKSDGDISSAPGQRISYALLAVNEGNMDAAGTVLTETVPANTRFDAGNSSPDWVCTPGIDAGSSCTVDLGTLAGSSFELRLFAVNVDNPVPVGTSMISNSASLDADNATIASGDDTTPLDVRLDLAVSKSDGGVTAYAGQTLAYTLSYSNMGTQFATGVSLNETVPLNTRFNSALSSAGWTCPDQAPAGTPCVLEVGALAVAASGMATFVVNVDDPVPNGVDTLSNSVQISDDAASGADVSPSDNTADVDTPVINPMLDLSITKTGVLDEMAGMVDYEINVANIGNIDDAGARLRDALADPVFDSASAAWSCVAAGGASCPPLGVGPIDVVVDLPMGSSLSVLISVPLLAVPIPEQILNVAEIAPSVADSDINPGNNIASSSIISCLFCNGFDPEVP